MSVEPYPPRMTVGDEVYVQRPDQLLLTFAPGRARARKEAILTGNGLTEHEPPPFSWVRAQLMHYDRIWVDAGADQLRERARLLREREEDVVMVTPVYVPASRPEDESAASPDPRIFAILPLEPNDAALRGEIEALGLEVDDAWSAAVAPYLRARLRREQPDDGFDVALRVASLPRVRKVELNWVKLDPLEQPSPTVPAAARSWRAAVGVDRARKDGGGSKNVVVAVIDTAFDVDHPSLKPALTPKASRRNFVANPPTNDVKAIAGDGTAQDPQWHGTAVAGLIGARGSQAALLGVASGVRILPIRADVGDSAHVEQAVSWAREQGADVVNMSFSCVATDTLGTALTNLTEPGGAVACAAAGNAGPTESDGVSYPAQHAGVIAVGACDQVGKRKVDDPEGERWYSRTGPELGVVAPGIRIATIDYSDGKGFNPGGAASPQDGKPGRFAQFYTRTYRGDEAGDPGGDFLYAFTGTSAAAAIVSGIAALVLSRDPTLRNDGVRKRIEESCDPVGGYDYQETWRPHGVWCRDMGHGRVDAAKAVPRGPEG